MRVEEAIDALNRLYSQKEEIIIDWVDRSQFDYLADDGDAKLDPKLWRDAVELVERTNDVIDLDHVAGKIHKLLEDQKAAKYRITIDLEPIIVVVEAKSDKQAHQKALRAFTKDMPDVASAIDYWVGDQEVIDDEDGEVEVSA